MREFQPTDTTLFSGPGLHVGKFRLAADDPRFPDTGPAGGNLLVFPRSAVTITHCGQPTVQADPNVVMLYNRGQEYRRGKIDERGDRCEYFHFDSAILQEALAQADPQVLDRPQAPFRWTHLRCRPATFLKQRLIVRILTTAGKTAPVADAVAEHLFELLDWAIADAGPQGRSAQPAGAERKSTGERHRVQVTAVQAWLYRHFDRNDSLAEIAGTVDASPYHLARLFRRLTGRTIHDFRNQLRLARALELLESRPADLTDLALRLGYSSHSHFSTAFRHAFGITPGDIRRSRLQDLLKFARF